MYKILTQTQELYGCWLKGTIDEKYYGWKISCLALSQCLTLPQGILYSEPWHIQSRGIFKTRGILETLSNIYNEAICKNSPRL